MLIKIVSPLSRIDVAHNSNCVVVLNNNIVLLYVSSWLIMIKRKYSIYCMYYNRSEHSINWYMIYDCELGLVGTSTSFNKLLNFMFFRN